jgi:SAM-dependent methyltransferase
MTVSFTCNICGAESTVEPSQMRREISNCSGCGSTPRWRSVIEALSVGLFGESLAISEFPAQPEVRGIGLTDSRRYASRLPAKLDYTNTFYDRFPRVDITDPPQELVGSCDFLIASDVFEHIPPPVERAFEGVYRLLKPGGIFVITVPYVARGKTREHFPDLHDYEIVQRNGSHVVVNRTPEGRVETFENPHFHGGAGLTLEMRMFSHADLLGHLRDAGFEEIREFTDAWPEPPTGYPVLAWRP